MVPTSIFHQVMAQELESIQSRHISTMIASEISERVLFCCKHCLKLCFSNNTETLEHPVTHQVEVYARCDIKAGVQVTTSYVPGSLPTLVKRQQLYTGWNFWCCCSKCSDRTELGTFTSALACCNKCPGGSQFGFNSNFKIFAQK